MRKYFEWIIPILVIIILILGGMILFNDVEGEYLFTGRLANQENSIDVDVIVM